MANEICIVFCFVTGRFIEKNKMGAYSNFLSDSRFVSFFKNYFTPKQDDKAIKIFGVTKSEQE